MHVGVHLHYFTLKEYAVSDYRAQTSLPCAKQVNENTICMFFICVVCKMETFLTHDAVSRTKHITFFQRDIIAARRPCVLSSSIFNETEYERTEYFDGTNFRRAQSDRLKLRLAMQQGIARDVRAVILCIRITSARAVINFVLRATNLERNTLLFRLLVRLEFPLHDGFLSYQREREPSRTYEVSVRILPVKY